MFLAHHAAGYAAKRFAPKVSLGVLFLAAMWLDLIWPLLTLGGVEHFRVDPGNTPFTPLDFYDYPITHSLVTVLGWSIAFGIAYHLVRKRSWSDAVVLGIAVFSHWLFDFVSHRPDLPLWPGGTMVGLGLWYSVPATVIVELLLYALGIGLYLKTTEAKGRTGAIALWTLVAFVLLIFVANVVSPPPPDWKAVSWTALAAWLFVPWGAWIDRHRRVRT